jgi:hypothetical protein
MEHFDGYTAFAWLNLLSSGENRIGGANRRNHTH